MMAWDSAGSSKDSYLLEGLFERYLLFLLYL